VLAIVHSAERQTTACSTGPLVSASISGSAIIFKITLLGQMVRLAGYSQVALLVDDHTRYLWGQMIWPPCMGLLDLSSAINVEQFYYTFSVTDNARSLGQTI